MKKCPRCQKNINDTDKFCPHCGLDLSASLSKESKKGSAIGGIMRLIAFVCLLGLPFLYTSVSDGSGIADILNNDEVTELGEYTNKDAQLILGQFDNLTDFNEKYSNVSSYVDGIVAFENNLVKDHLIYDKEYIILVLDNNEIVFHLEYTSRIDENHELTIIREYNRMHTYNKQEIIFKKENQPSFDELLLNSDEISFVKNYTADDSDIEPVLNEFSSRKEEFDEKKDGLGHFGLGTYHDNASFVVKKYGDVYTSIYTQYETVNEFIS